MEHAAQQHKAVIHSISVLKAADDLSQIINALSDREHCAWEIDGRENALIQNEPVRSVCIGLTPHDYARVVHFDGIGEARTRHVETYEVAHLRLAV